jgi:hypothetical protein
VPIPYDPHRFEYTFVDASTGSGQLVESLEEFDWQLFDHEGKLADGSPRRLLFRRVLPAPGPFGWTISPPGPKVPEWLPDGVEYSRPLGHGIRVIDSKTGWIRGTYEKWVVDEDEMSREQRALLSRSESEVKALEIIEVPRKVGSEERTSDLKTRIRDLKSEGWEERHPSRLEFYTILQRPIRKAGNPHLELRESERRLVDPVKLYHARHLALEYDMSRRLKFREWKFATGLGLATVVAFIVLRGSDFTTTQVLIAFVLSPVIGWLLIALGQFISVSFERYTKA